MKTEFHLLTAGLLLAAVGAGLGQPVITQQPQSSTNVVFTTAMFSVQATGTPPLAYQWQANAGALDFYALTGCSNATMGVTNVQTSHAGDYRVVIANVDGAVTSALARLTVVVPPRIAPTTSLQHQVARIGTAASFAVSASGTAPFAYQWRLDGQELALETNRILHFSAVQLADEGDYTVEVTNLAGAVTSAPARLWVVPPASGVVNINFTNNLGRLPYCYVLPTDYEAGRYYPLWLSFHGSPADETMAFPTIINAPGFMLMTSHGRQPPDPVIQLWPTRRAGDESWTDASLRQVSALLTSFSPSSTWTPTESTSVEARRGYMRPGT